MRKLPLILLVLVGTCAAQDQHPITQLQGTARVLIVFTPDSSSANYKRQLQLIERHAFELAERNTVVVPVPIASHASDESFSGENLPLGNANEQADARSRFHVQPGDFLVILLNQDGTEKIRSAHPVDIHELTAGLDKRPTLRH